MKHRVFRYLEWLKKRTIIDYKQFNVLYAGMDPRRLATKSWREQFLKNEVFKDGKYEKPVFDLYDQEEDFDNPVQCYASYLFEKLEDFNVELEKYTDADSAQEYLKAINDLKQILSILKLHFTVVPFKDYSRKGIWYEGITEEQLAKFGWLLIDDPKTWAYLPESVIENILDESMCVPINKKVTPVYRCSKGTIVAFIEDLSENFENFSSDVYFAPAVFESFLAILEGLENCENVQIEHFEHCTKIYLEYYPERYKRVKLKLLFEEQNDDTWRLVGRTHSSSDTDPTLFIQRAEKETGYFVDSYFEQDPFFNGSDKKEFTFLSYINIIYFE